MSIGTLVNRHQFDCIQTNWALQKISDVFLKITWVLVCIRGSHFDLWWICNSLVFGNKFSFELAQQPNDRKVQTQLLNTADNRPNGSMEPCWKSYLAECKQTNFKSSILVIAGPNTMILLSKDWQRISFCLDW